MAEEKHRISKSYDPPTNYCWYDKPLEEDTYDHRPPKSECKIIRRNLNAFTSAAAADAWARSLYEVVEPLHTVHCFAWRVKK